MTHLQRLGRGIGFEGLIPPSALAEGSEFLDVSFGQLLRLNDPTQRIPLPGWALFRPIEDNF
jgi:hypothetical protein